jgi:hypothetical protein
MADVSALFGEHGRALAGFDGNVLFPPHWPEADLMTNRYLPGWIDAQNMIHPWVSHERQ